MAVLLLMLVMAAVLPFLGVNGQSCNLDEYNLNAEALRLPNQKAWYATFTGDGCIVEPKTGETCVLYFTVCDTLPKDVCNTTGSGMCQRIQDTQSPPNVTARFELGKTTDQLNATNHKEGFSIDYTTNVTNPHCNGTTNHTTVVVTEFRCSVYAIWSPNRLDVSQYLVEFSVIPGTCLYTAVFNYSGACIQAVPVEPTICNLVHYNGSALKVQNPWLIELSGMCYDPRMSPNTAQNALRAGQEACSILVSFCNVLPNVLCSDSMMCELIDGEPNPYSFGKFNSRLRYEEDFNGKGFVGNLFDGTKTNKCPDGLSAAINFVCDPKAVWDSDNITKFVVAKPNYIDCQFQLTVNYSGACGQPFGAESASPVGWILMGLFVAAVLAYFLVGSLVQFVRGRRGIEVIPNFDFWKQFPILVVGGFKFVVDRVTCYSIKNIRGSSKPVTEYDKL